MRQNPWKCMTSARWRQQHCVYMAKVLVKIRHRERAGGRAGEEVGVRSEGGEELRPGGTERHEGGGCWSGVPASWISQPLGEVFRKYPFGGVLFVLLPVVLLHAHQPAVILAEQTRKDRLMLLQVLGWTINTTLDCQCACCPTCSSGLSNGITRTTSPAFISSSSVSLAA